MKLAFEALELEHFRSFSSRQTVNLSLVPGLYFLKGENTVEPQLGSNGAGKSSVFAALCWVLYGRTANGLRNPDIKPWVGKGVPKVSLRLWVDDNPRTITRAARTNGLSIDGEEVGPDEAAKLIGLSFEAFTNTLYLAQGAPLFFDRTPKEKLELFTEVLALERWEERSKRAGVKVRELEDLEREILGELGGLDIARKQNDQSIEHTKRLAEDWEEDKKAKAKSALTDIKKMEEELARSQAALDEATLKNEAAWLKLREMRADVNALRSTADSARRQFTTEEGRVAGVERELRKLTTELKELDKAKSCPTCGQPIVKKGLAKHKQELQEELEDLEGRKGFDRNTKILYEGAIGALKNFEAELAKAEAETDIWQSKINIVQPNVLQLKTAIAQLGDARNRAQTEENPHLETLSNLRRQKSALAKQSEELEADIQKAQRQLERTKFWVKGFKDVALYLIEEVLVELEAVTNAILGEVGLVGWEVRYALERETKSGTVQRGITVTMLPPLEKGRPSSIRWESWSGGEEQRLRIVGAVALSEVLLRHAGVQSSLEVFDEPAKYVSGAGVNDLCEYLKERARSHEKVIFLVDHLARESSLFAGTVTVKKTLQGSRIYQEA